MPTPRTLKATAPLTIPLRMTFADPVPRRRRQGVRKGVFLGGAGRLVKQEATGFAQIVHGSVSAVLPTGHDR